MTTHDRTARRLASLLRLAQEDLDDAGSLLQAGGLRNAAALQHAAATHLAAALAASEGDSEAADDPSLLSADNPLRAKLQEAWGEEDPALLEDGELAEAPDRAALQRRMRVLEQLLGDACRGFGVDPLGDAPARSTAPIRPAPEPDTTPEPAPDTPSHATGSITSAEFWTLAERWGLEDLEALELLGHAGGLTRKGTRPRFKFSADEAEMAAALRGLDQALSLLQLDPKAWLRDAQAPEPFRRRTPMKVLREDRLAGARAVTRALTQLGLKRSLQQG